MNSACSCGQELPKRFQDAARCYACGSNGMGSDQVWLKIKGVCTPYHRGCAPVEMEQVK